MKKLFKAAAFFSASLLLALTACKTNSDDGSSGGGGGGGGGGGSSVPVTSIKFNEAVSGVLSGVETGPLALTVTPDNATDKTVSWTVSDSTIASIDKTSGKIKGLVLGLVTITATANDGSGVKAECKVVVRKKLSDAAAEDIGKVIGADGYIYNHKTSAEAIGTTASAMIAYIGSATGAKKDDINASMPGFTKGLAISLKDVQWQGSVWVPNWADVQPAINAYDVVRPTNVSNWFLPNAYQWMWLLKGCGSSDTPAGGDLVDGKEFKPGNLAMNRQNAGGSYMMGDYWTDTEKNSKIFIYRLKGTNNMFHLTAQTHDPKTELTSYYINAAFAF